MWFNPPPLSTLTCTPPSHFVPPNSGLDAWAARGFSQFGADGVIHKIFDDIGTRDKYFVEFGTQSGVQCNTRRLREVCGWKGLLMDGGFENEAINLHREFITAENIARLFKKYNVPHTFDLLSVDIDGNDYHVLKKILRHGYIPRVIIVETNFGVLSKHAIMKYNPNFLWKGECSTSASVAAYKKLLTNYQHVASLRPDTYWVHKSIPMFMFNYSVPDISTNACLSKAMQ